MEVKELCKKILAKMRLFFIAKVGKVFLRLLYRTCYIHVTGLEDFLRMAENGPCVLVLWHNRLAIMPFILSHYTPEISYAAVVSASRDGKILSTIVRSFQKGHTIEVGHQTRHQALREIIRAIREDPYVVVITPDGPRGPRYKVKPGISMAAIETQAQIIAVNWESDRFWELKTWDRLRFPKPFSTVTVTLKAAVKFDTLPLPSLEEATRSIQEALLF